MNLSIKPSTLYSCFYFFRIRSWDTLSNALAKSKYITSAFDILLRVSIRSFVNGTICVVHDFAIVKPRCLGSMSCSQELSSSFLMHLLKTFIIRDGSIIFYRIFLCTGTTEASFHSFGILPLTRDILNIIFVNGFAKVDAQFFNTMPCIPSGPAVLLWFI